MALDDRRVAPRQGRRSSDAGRDVSPREASRASGSLEDTLGALLSSRLVPLRSDLQRVTAELAAMRQALPPALLPLKDAARRMGVSEKTARGESAPASGRHGATAAKCSSTCQPSAL